MDVGELLIFALAAVLAFVPALVDRWAIRRGASPEALIALATVTLAGIAALPLAFAICTGALAAQAQGHVTPSVAAVIGLLLVAIAAGRTLARMIAIRRRWKALSRVAAALELPGEPGGVRVLPVDELLAFASGTEAFISQGLIDQLSASDRRAVIEHEREHARRGHARLAAAARALAHGSFEIAPARRASQALDRELDVLADRGAAQRLGDATAVESALRTLIADNGQDPTTRDQATTHRRLERLASPTTPRRVIVDAAVRLVTLAVAAGVLTAFCLSLHASTVWLGVAACLLFAASLVVFIAPVLAPHAGGRPPRTSDDESARTPH